MLLATNSSRSLAAFLKNSTNPRKRLLASRGRCVRATSERRNRESKAPADRRNVWFVRTTPCSSVREGSIADPFPDPRQHTAITVVKHSYQMFQSASELYAYTILLIYTVFCRFQEHVAVPHCVATASDRSCDDRHSGYACQGSSENSPGSCPDSAGYPMSGTRGLADWRAGRPARAARRCGRDAVASSRAQRPVAMVHNDRPAPGGVACGCATGETLCDPRPDPVREIRTARIGSARSWMADGLLLQLASGGLHGFRRTTTAVHFCRRLAIFPCVKMVR